MVHSVRASCPWPSSSRRALGDIPSPFTKGLIDAPVERALSALRKLRNAFAHSTESASLADPAHSARLAEIYAEARTNPLWAPLEPALRDYILLITILVAFLEATAQQLRPYQPPVVMGFSGVIRQDPAG